MATRASCASARAGRRLAPRHFDQPLSALCRTSSGAKARKAGPRYLRSCRIACVHADSPLRGTPACASTHATSSWRLLLATLHDLRRWEAEAEGPARSARRRGPTLGPKNAPGRVPAKRARGDGRQRPAVCGATLRRERVACDPLGREAVATATSVRSSPAQASWRELSCVPQASPQPGGKVIAHR